MTTTQWLDDLLWHWATTSMIEPAHDNTFIVASFAEQPKPTVFHGFADLEDATTYAFQPTVHSDLRSIEGVTTSVLFFATLARWGNSIGLGYIGKQPLSLRNGTLLSGQKFELVEGNNARVNQALKTEYYWEIRADDRMSLRFPSWMFTDADIALAISHTKAFNKTKG